VNKETQAQLDRKETKDQWDRKETKDQKEIKVYLVLPALWDLRDHKGNQVPKAQRDLV
tara:strand:- start:358 stop:531 length:174 start_codon:yes stop_codon:yes gene_type:complete